MKDKLFQIAPVFLQNSMITLYNFLEYQKRYGKDYLTFKKQFKKTATFQKMSC